MTQLILIRHGQSIWNSKIDLRVGLTLLSDKGRLEASNAGKLLKS